jgi:hypothetical protein
LPSDARDDVERVTKILVEKLLQLKIRASE